MYRSIRLLNYFRPFNELSFIRTNPSWYIRVRTDKSRRSWIINGLLNIEMTTGWWQRTPDYIILSYTHEINLFSENSINSLRFLSRKPNLRKGFSVRTRQLFEIQAGCVYFRAVSFPFTFGGFSGFGMAGWQIIIEAFKFYRHKRSISQ